MSTSRNRPAAALLCIAEGEMLMCPLGRWRKISAAILSFDLAGAVLEIESLPRHQSSPRLVAPRRRGCTSAARYGARRPRIKEDRWRFESIRAIDLGAWQMCR